MSTKDYIASALIVLAIFACSGIESYPPLTFFVFAAFGVAYILEKDGEISCDDDEW